MTNRQIEKEVKQTLPPVKKRTLVLVLEGDMLNVWEQTREACERLAGKALTDIEVFDLMCAEVLCTYATTPPFDPEKEDDGGAVRSIAERDGWKCTRPGCRSRTALQGDHIVPRSQGGRDKDWNKTTLCAVCHHAKTTGILKVSGRAPDGLTWEGPFGVIEKPLPLPPPRPTNGAGGSIAREARTSYGSENPPTELGAMVSVDDRSRDHFRMKDGKGTDHVITHVGAPRTKKKTPRAGVLRRGASGKTPSQHRYC
jgi:hypothetical protein